MGRRKKIYFDVTNGGEAGQGQVWEYDPERETLTLIYESPNEGALSFPDNVVIVPKTGHILLQEDGAGEQFIRGVTLKGEIYDFAKTAANATEFAGGCFDPNRQILFVNQQGDRGNLPGGPPNTAPSRTRSGGPGSPSTELAALLRRASPARPAARLPHGGLLPFPTTFTSPLPTRGRARQDTLFMGQGNGTRTLLCELHAHTTWSDGELTLRELVDLYGRAGFDVLCVTDHVLRSADPWRVPETCVHEANFHEYLAAIDVEAERARALYGMLVVPGLELTHNHREPDLSAHALAIGLRQFVTPDLGLVGALWPRARPAPR